MENDLFRQQQGQLHSEYAKLEKLSILLDDAVRIPGTEYRLGLDFLIGLIPIIGDLAGAGFSLYIVQQAKKFGVPRFHIMRMLLNIGIELVLGSIPLIGDIFDASWRANRRNMKILQNYLGKQAETES